MPAVERVYCGFRVYMHRHDIVFKTDFRLQCVGVSTCGEGILW